MLLAGSVIVLSMPASAVGATFPLAWFTTWKVIDSGVPAVPLPPDPVKGVPTRV
jgi:hypothetical protein